jgi:hypothetical protein
MGINLKLPNISGNTPTEQMRQMQSYLFQMVEQLNWALGTLETSNGSTSVPSTVPSAIKFEQNEDITPQEAESTFNSIKALIIKSADIVKAYEETIMKNFNGSYFADSDFGTYLEETSRSIEANSKGVRDVYTNVQTLTTTLGEEIKKTETYINRGHLYYDSNGDSVVGIEIGETKNGAFVKCAQFTAGRLTFYDIGGNPVAYIGAGDKDKTDTNCLYILGKAVFLGDVRLGGYNADTSDGLAFLWIE